MFGTAETSDYDLRFTLLNTPVRVTPMFWVGTLLFGFMGGDRSFDAIAIWVVVVFVSIIWHEMGHALAFRWFGVRSHVVLYQMGGYAQPDRALPTVPTIITYAAGPLAGLLLGLLFYMIPGDISGPRWAYARLQLLWVNIAWSVVNLAPIFPLDGGGIMRGICLLVSPAHGYRTSLLISMVTGALVAYLFYDWGMTFSAFFFGVLGYYAFQQWQESAPHSRGGSW